MDVGFLRYKHSKVKYVPIPRDQYGGCPRSFALTDEVIHFVCVNLHLDDFTFVVPIIVWLAAAHWLSSTSVDTKLETQDGPVSSSGEESIPVVLNYRDNFSVDIRVGVGSNFKTGVKFSRK